MIDLTKTKLPLTLTQTDEIKVVWDSNNVPYTEQYPHLRMYSYPTIGDQLDIIYKIFKALSDSNKINLPPEGLDWINKITAIKNKYPIS